MIDMNVVFLDVDGVMVSYSKLKDRDSEDHCQLFIPEAVEALNQLVERMDAKVVVSSSWRIGKTVDYLQDIFNRRGCKVDIIGKTPTSNHSQRGKEIQEWIEKNGWPNSFIIIDDEVSDIRPYFKNWYLTDRIKGLELWQVDVILERIKNQVLN